MTTAHAADLERSRNKVLARSFYRQLKTEGLSHEQIIELSAVLLDLVTADIQKTQSQAS